MAGPTKRDDHAGAVGRVGRHFGAADRRDRPEPGGVSALLLRMVTPPGSKAVHWISVNPAAEAGFEGFRRAGWHVRSRGGGVLDPPFGLSLGGWNACRNFKATSC